MREVDEGIYVFFASCPVVSGLIFNILLYGVIIFFYFQVGGATTPFINGTISP